MPIYEYHCQKCGTTAEVIHGFNEKKEPKCPECNKKMKRAISRNAFHLKGTGWYKTDYAKPSTMEKKSPKGENKAPGTPTTASGEKTVSKSADS